MFPNEPKISAIVRRRDSYYFHHPRFGCCAPVEQDVARGIAADFGIRKVRIDYNTHIITVSHPNGAEVGKYPMKEGDRLAIDGKIISGVTPLVEEKRSKS